jgi:hypothetical protein
VPEAFGEFRAFACIALLIGYFIWVSAGGGACAHGCLCAAMDILKLVGRSCDQIVWRFELSESSVLDCALYHACFGGP